MIKLYGHLYSGPTMLVEIALRLFQLKFEFIPVALEAGEQHKEGFLQKNPRGLVPVLELSTGEVLIESVAICRYLARLHGREDLFPKEPSAEYQLESWLDHLRMSLCKPLGVIQWNRVWVKKFGKAGAIPDTVAVERASCQVYRALGDLESHLLGRTSLLSPMLQAPSFADWISLPWLGYYQLAEISLLEYPRVQQWLHQKTSSDVWTQVLKQRPLLADKTNLKQEMLPR